MLRRPCFQRDRSTGITCPIAERSDTATIFIHEIFQIIKRAAPGLETFQQCTARVLPLIGVAEHDVAMGQGCSVLWQFLEAEYDRIQRRVGPGILSRDLATGILVAVNRNGANRTFLDRYADARRNQRSGAFGGQAYPFLVRALFCADPEMCHSYSFCQSIPAARTA